MEISLAENIRRFRRERRLTQEQLAETLGVTAGAVYKWEAALSLPEITTLTELADFFDCSVDVLLGYGVKDNRIDATVKRLRRCRIEKDEAGLSECEKALKKYPNSFEVVYASAQLYCRFGVSQGDKAKLERALEVLSDAVLLLPQNTDPKIGESTLYGEMAQILLGLGRADEAVELLRKNNVGGTYNARIGFALAANCERPKDAKPYLSDALLGSIVELVHIVMGYVNVCLEENDYAAAENVITWGTELFSGLKSGGGSCFLDKMNAVLFVCLAYSHLKLGLMSTARGDLLRAKELSERFDAAPDYSVRALRFIGGSEEAGVYDDLGETAMESVERTLEAMESEELSAMWKELSADGK